MPRELIAVEPRTPVIREYADEALGDGEVRATTLYGAPKHGSEMHLYRGDSPFVDSRYDKDRRIFLDGAEKGSGVFPLPLGNAAVGEVVEVGPGVGGVEVGDQVAGYGPLRETQTWAWGATGAYPGVRKMPPEMSWQAALCLDPAVVALGGVREGGVRVGERVAVFGMGAIGLLAVQLARVAGASSVVAVDPISSRRRVALEVGADHGVDPTATDAGLAVRRTLGDAGADVSIETSGSAEALHHSIRGAAYRATVAACAWYGEFRGGLDLGREAHFNRPTIVFPRAESEPHHDHPRWNHVRLADAAWQLLAEGRLKCEPVVQPIVPFSQAAEAYREIDEYPERVIKLGVVFEPVSGSDSGGGR